MQWLLILFLVSSNCSKGRIEATWKSSSGYILHDEFIGGEGSTCRDSGTLESKHDGVGTKFEHYIDTRAQNIVVLDVNKYPVTGVWRQDVVRQ